MSFGDNLLGSYLKGLEVRKNGGWASESLGGLGVGGVKAVECMKKVFVRCPIYILITDII